MENKIFHENISLWSRSYPKLALLLQYYHQVKTELFISHSYVNLKKGQFIYHDLIDPEKEAKSWFQSLNKNGIEVLYVYGVGIGYYYDALKPWLEENPKRKVVFLEDDLEVIHALFHLQRGSDILRDKQAKLFYFNDIKNDKEAFDDLYWDYILTQMEVSALSSYKESKQEIYHELKHRIVHDAAIKNALVDEYLHFGAAFFRNFYPNMLLLPESWQGTKLYGKFENIPAIICGAGPSLEKNIHVLKDYLDRAIILGGGSALNALSSKGILPHFGIGVDPNPTQQYRLSSNKAYEVPLFYRNRMHHEAFKLVHGPRLYIPGAGGYEVADWFDEKFNLLEGISWLDEGHNVVNFGLELAKYLGCNPIIFVGVDLAYTELQSYASGIIENTNVDTSEILETGDFDTTALLKEDIYGKPIYTLWKWIAESEWITEYAKANPELTIINATEGGLGMEDIPNMSLLEVGSLYLKHSYDLHARVQGEIINSPLKNLTNEKMIRSLSELNESLKRSLEHIAILVEDKQQYEKKLMETKKLQDYSQSGHAALAETELEEEPAYEHIIGIFNLVYSRILNKEIQDAKDDQSIKDDYIKEIEKNRVNIKRLHFMQDLARVNIYVIEKALKERLETM